MKKTASLCFIALFAFVSFDLYAADKHITPDAFEAIAGTSIDLMRPYKGFLDRITKYGPVFLFEGEGIMPNPGMNTYYAVTVDGPLEVTPMQLDGTLYWNAVREKDYSVAFFVTFSASQLKLLNTAATVNGYPVERYAKMPGLVGARLVPASGGWDCTVGLLEKFYPFTGTGPLGEKVFSARAAAENEDPSDILKFGIFLQTDIYGFDLGAFFDFETGPQTTSLGYMFDLGGSAGKIGPAASYSKYLDNLQLGASYETSTLGGRLDLNAEVFMDAYKRGFVARLAHALAAASLIFFRDTAPAGSADTGYFMAARLSASYSGDIFPEGLFGGSGEVSFENMELFKNQFFRLALGFSYNYYDMLYRMPIKDEALLFCAFRWMIK